MCQSGFSYIRFNHIFNQQMINNQNLLTQLDHAQIALVNAHLDNYCLLRKHGPYLFNDDGTIETTDQNGEKHSRPGRDFILKTLKYFERMDDPAAYRRCAVVKKVLDAYDRQFK